MFIWLRSFLRSRHDLGLEIVVQRQQLIVLKRRTKRPRLRGSDRLFWVLLRRVCPKWSNPLLIVKPETIVRWHRKGFRLYWRFRSRSKTVGRPVTGPEARTALHTMASENPTWGAPRIHGELLMLGFVISERTVSRYLARLHRRDGAAQLWRNLSEESPGANRRDRFLHRDYSKLPDSILLIPDSAQSPRDHSLECHRAPPPVNGWCNNFARHSLKARMANT